MADGGGMGGVKFGLTNNKGVMNPVQIEKLEGLDTVVLRGSPQDVEQARRMIQQVEQLGEKGKDLPATGLASLDFQLPGTARFTASRPRRARWKLRRERSRTISSGGWPKLR